MRLRLRWYLVVVGFWPYPIQSLLTIDSALGREWRKQCNAHLGIALSLMIMISQPYFGTLSRYSPYGNIDQHRCTLHTRTNQYTTSKEKHMHIDHHSISSCGPILTEEMSGGAFYRTSTAMDMYPPSAEHWMTQCILVVYC